LGEARGEIIEQSLNADFARSRLGWQPSLSLEQGLDRTIDWYKSFFARESRPSRARPSAVPIHRRNRAERPSYRP
jgi:dTDP-D-glucose 4,6-dehydratase